MQRIISKVTAILSILLSALVLLLALPLAFLQVLWAVAGLMSNLAVSRVDARRIKEGPSGFPQHEVND